MGKRKTVVQKYFKASIKRLAKKTKSTAKTLKPFSVLLLYPDYIASNYGEETYYEFVRAKDATSAIVKAQKRCVKAGELELVDLSDLAVLLVIRGHHYGI